ncbi:MAG: cyclic nucleotide-binding domain-containing protein [Pseudomonadota bacterium]
MPIIEPSSILDSLSTVPLVEFAEGDLLLRQGDHTERLLFLKDGAVEILRDGAVLASVSEPGAVFGDMAVILGRPHSADVLATQPSLCHVIENPAQRLKADPALALYVMTVLATRLDAVNGSLIEARERLGESDRGFLADTLDKLGRAMGVGVPL